MQYVTAKHDHAELEPMNGDREWEPLVLYDDGRRPKRGDRYDNAGLATFGAICYATAVPKTIAPGSVRLSDGARALSRAPQRSLPTGYRYNRMAALSTFVTPERARRFEFRTVARTSVTRSSGANLKVNFGPSKC